MDWMTEAFSPGLLQCCACCYLNFPLAAGARIDELNLDLVVRAEERGELDERQEEGSTGMKMKQL